MAGEATARRKRTLADKSIQNPTLAEEAEAQVAKLKAVLEQHRRALTIGGIAVADGGRYAITAPADGRVVDQPVMPGDKVDAMAAAVTLDTSGELMIEVQVPSDLAMRLKPGDRVQVVGGPEGKVISIAATLDRMTRSARCWRPCPQAPGSWPGRWLRSASCRRPRRAVCLFRRRRLPASTTSTASSFATTPALRWCR